MSVVGRAVGIDLGTTYSAIAALGPDGRPTIVPNREGERITPSVVLFHDDGVLVGSAAKQAATDAPDDVVQFVKRRMGDRSWAFVTSSGEQVDAESVSAAILRRLKDDAELALGEPVTHAVITVPAYFDDARRQATIDAGEIAGFTVLGVINEPTAAAVHDGLETGMQGNVLVYDLGGTFDVTVMRIEGNDFRVLSVQGDRNLGGFNWDNEVMRYIADQVHRESGTDPLTDDLLEAELRDKAERAKRALTTTPETRVVLRVDRKSYSVKVTRPLFDELTRGLLARTRSNVELALADAGLAPSDIDELLLVGGSTRMPMVRDLLTSMIGRPPRVGGNPDESVALGAAVPAGLLAATAAAPAPGATPAPAPAPAPATAPAAAPGPAAGRATDTPTGPASTVTPLPTAAPARPVAIHDVTALGLGVVTVDPRSGRTYNYVLLPRNSPIPASGSADFMTTESGRTRLQIDITEGDDEDVDFVTVVGSGSITLPARAERSPVVVAISFSADAVIYAEVFDGIGGGKLGDLHIERRSNLTRAQIDRAAGLLRRREVG